MSQSTKKLIIIFVILFIILVIIIVVAVTEDDPVEEITEVTQNFVTNINGSANDTNETPRVDNITGDDCPANQYSYGFDNTTAQILCRTDQTGGAGSYDLNISNGSTANVITDSEVLSLLAGSGIFILQEGNDFTIIGTVTDSTLGQEEVQDFAWGSNILTGTQTGITVTYDDANDEVDFVVTGGGSDDTFYLDVQNVLNTTSYYNLTIVNGSNTYFLVAEDTRHMILEGEFQ
jgi:hypothetical protein